jgi:hypothetical protein
VVVTLQRWTGCTLAIVLPQSDAGNGQQPCCTCTDSARLQAVQGAAAVRGAGAAPAKWSCRRGSAPPSARAAAALRSARRCTARCRCSAGGKLSTTAILNSSKARGVRSVPCALHTACAMCGRCVRASSGNPHFEMLLAFWRASSPMESQGVTSVSFTCASDSGESAIQLRFRGRETITHDCAAVPASSE